MAGGIGRVYVPCRFDYAAGRKQRREAIAPVTEGARAEHEQTKPQFEPKAAEPPKRTPRNVVAVGMFV